MFVSIAAGDVHTCGLTADGRVFCWGSNEIGQLAAAASDTCAVPIYDDSGNQLGDGTITNYQPQPVRVLSPADST